eukprot:3691066-Amphidinium_carterae.1
MTKVPTALSAQAMEELCARLSKPLTSRRCSQDALIWKKRREEEETSYCSVTSPEMCRGMCGGPVAAPQFTYMLNERMGCQMGTVTENTDSVACSFLGEESKECSFHPDVRKSTSSYNKQVHSLSASALSGLDPGMSRGHE